MPKKQYVVQLSDEEHHQILELTRKGTIAARTLARAHILRLANEGQPDSEIVEALGVGLSTVERTRKKYVEGDWTKRSPNGHAQECRASSQRRVKRT